MDNISRVLLRILFVTSSKADDCSKTHILIVLVLATCFCHTVCCLVILFSVYRVKPSYRLKTSVLWPGKTLSYSCGATVTMTLSVLDAPLLPCSSVTIVTSPVTIIITLLFFLLSLPVTTLLHLTSSIVMPPSPVSIFYPHSLPPSLSHLHNRGIMVVRWAER